MSSLSQMAAWNDANNETTGSLGNNTWWYSAVSGQDFYDMAIATNGSMGDEFWKAFGWGRRTAALAIDTAFAYTREDGTVVELDGLLVPSDSSGGFDNGCSSVPSYAGYPIASVPIGQSGFGVPCGFCIHGRQFGEPKLIRVASAMEDLFQWNAQPRWYNYDTAEGPWDAPWPGYTCSSGSLERYACDDDLLLEERGER